MATITKSQFITMYRDAASKINQFHSIFRDAVDNSYDYELNLYFCINDGRPEVLVLLDEQGQNHEVDNNGNDVTLLPGGPIGRTCDHIDLNMRKVEMGAWDMIYKKFSVPVPEDTLIIPD